MSGKKIYKCDLHIHSCLSPCSDILMTPGNIIERALTVGLDCIAITDHNTGANVEVAMNLAVKTGLTIIPAMEVESIEEVHLLCFFPKLEQLKKWDIIVRENMPEKSNDEEIFGYQLLTDENDEYLAKDERLLATASKLSVNDIVDGVVSLGGIVIPSHIDRTVNSIIGQLGFIPPELSINIVELSRNTDPDSFFKTNNYLKEYTYIVNSDSHYLDDIGKCGQDHNGFNIERSIFPGGFM